MGRGAGAGRYRLARGVGRHRRGEAVPIHACRIERAPGGAGGGGHLPILWAARQGRRLAGA
jgi:hypothetical protein